MSPKSLYNQANPYASHLRKSTDNSQRNTFLNSQEGSASKKRAQSANRMAGLRINKKGSAFHQSQNLYGKIVKHELESSGAHHLSRA